MNVCQDSPKHVFVWKPAVADAERLLKLVGDKQIIDFIGNGGLENPTVVNKPPFLDRNGNDLGMTIHAYKFASNLIQMYIAFFYNEKQVKWNLKSFHEPNDPRPTLGDKLQELILQKKLEQKP